MIIVLIVLIVFYSICFLDPSIKEDVFYLSIPFVYWVTTIYYLFKYKIKNLFCFELFFAISYYLCSFLTRFFLPLLNAYESRAFINDSTLIYKAYALSIMGYLCYMLGLIVRRKPTTLIERKTNHFYFPQISNRSNMLANVFCTFFIVLMFLNGGSRLFTMYSDEGSFSTNRLSGFAAYLTFAIITYIVSIVTNFGSISKNVKQIHFLSLRNTFSVLFIINSIILIGTFLLSGYRSNAIQILIPLVIAYQIRFKPIKPALVLLLLMGGAFLMFFIGIVRTGDTFNLNDYSLIVYLRDFKPANAATIYMIAYADQHGVTGGSNMLFPILSIIPGLQSIVGLFVDINTVSPVSSVFFTKAFSSDSGFGTSITGDLYYTFGYIGVLVLMYLYGRCLSRLSQYKNKYELVLFLSFSGNALFAPRVEFCYIIRSLAWSVIFLYLIINLSKNKANG